MSIKRRIPLPSKIANAPILHDGLGLYYAAFLELSTDRDYGMGMGPIPYSSIADYLDRLGIEDDSWYEDFVDFIRALDSAFISYENQRQKDTAKSNSRSRSDDDG